MKYFFLIILIIMVGCEKKDRSPKKGILEVIPKYCKYNNSGSLSFNRQFKLFKKGNKPIEIKIKEKNFVSGNNAIISGLDYGDYYIEYITIYNQKNVVEFKISQDRKKSVEFCLDYIDYSANKNLLLIDDLENGEKLILDYSNIGCFDSDQTPDILRISKINEKVFAEYKGKTLELSPKQIALFREFEIELRCNHRYGCTTVDTYGITRINGRYESHTFTDGSCQWMGFYHLLDTLKITTANTR